MTAKKPQSIEDVRRLKRAPRETVTIDLDGKTEFEFVFKGMGRRAFSDLSDAHASPDDPSGWDLDEFSPALVAASCESPTMTVEQAKELWEDPEWTSQDLDKLLTAALKVSATFRR